MLHTKVQLLFLPEDGPSAKLTACEEMERQRCLLRVRGSPPICLSICLSFLHFSLSHLHWRDSGIVFTATASDKRPGPQCQASKPQSKRRVGVLLILLSPPFRSTMPSFSLCPTLHEIEPTPRCLPSLLTPTAKELNTTQQPWFFSPQRSTVEASKTQRCCRLLMSDGDFMELN